MAITIDGTTGIAGVDGSASTPAYQGADTNTGIAFPAADTVSVATGGSERMRIASAGGVHIGTTSTYGTNSKLSVFGSATTADTGIVLSDGATTTIGLALATPSTGSVPYIFGNNNLAFGSNGAERMRIDSSGRVTMPYQVCCFAYSTTGQTIPNTTGTKVQMNTVGYETGVTFDTSNYRFTAPVSGKYLITVAVSMDNAPNVVHAGIFLNGSGSGAPSSGLPNGYLQSGNGNTGTTQVGVINTRIMKLNSGDYIEAYTYHSSGVSKTLDNSGRNYISIVFLG